jgi:hypothetical protein
VIKSKITLCFWGIIVLFSAMAITTSACTSGKINNTKEINNSASADRTKHQNGIINNTNAKDNCSRQDRVNLPDCARSTVSVDKATVYNNCNHTITVKWDIAACGDERHDIAAHSSRTVEAGNGCGMRDVYCCPRYNSCSDEKESEYEKGKSKTIEEKQMLNISVKNFSSFQRNLQIFDNVCQRKVLTRSFDPWQEISISICSSDANDNGYGDILYRDTDSNSWSERALINGGENINL